MKELIKKLDEMIEFDKKHLEAATGQKKKALEAHLTACEAFREAFAGGEA